jgi:hypothetical protein
MVNNNGQDRSTPNTADQPESSTDEKLGVMVYGNLKIFDVSTGEVLVNKRA